MYGEPFPFPYSNFLFAPMLQPLDDLVQRHGNDTQDDNGCNHHIELENLASINDQITKPPSGCQEFTDDDTDKGQANIYLHRAEYNRNGSGQDHFK